MSAIIIMLNVILVDNFVLSKFLGICPFLGVSGKRDSAIGMGLAVTFVLTLSSAVTWPIYNYILAPNGLGYFDTLVFILVIATLVQLVEMILKKVMPALHKSLGVYLPLITTNCAVLGATLLNVENNYNFLESLANGFGAGAGFLLAMFLFSGVRERMEGNNIPKAFRGMPIALAAASIVALSFMGFSGVIEHLFG